MKKIEKLLKAKAIAVVGASSHRDKIGHQILNNLISGGYKGKIYPVNPKASQILGLKVYPDINSISNPVDLAIIVIPSEFVLPVLKQCAENKVKAVIVISAGFAEMGSEGEKLQNEMVKICDDAGITLLGPNCLGLIDTDRNLNASFAHLMPKKGNISLISQSGAMISALIDWSCSAEQGFNKIFSMGNEAQIKAESVFQYLYNDPDTKVIIVYMEQLKVTKELTKLLTKYSKLKPTVVLFGGKTSSGAKAASSHTGSIISSYLAIETYLKQAGVIVASNLSEVFVLCRLFSNYRKIESNNVVIITNAGGPAIVTTDEIYVKNLKLAKLSAKSTDSLEKNCRPCANTKNPVDLLGDATEGDYKKALNIVEGDSKVDGVIVLLTPQSSTDVVAIASVIANFSSKKPIVSAFIGGDNLNDGRKIIEKSGKPCYSNPDKAVTALSALVSFSKANSQLLPTKESEDLFSENQQDKLMRKFSLPFLDYQRVETFKDLKKIADRIKYPVVLKTANPEIIHKTDSGSVKLDIKNETELEKAYHELGSPVIVGKMIKGKVEIFLGIKKDPNIGTLVAFGTGGIYSQIDEDFSYRVSPLSKNIALEMIKETKVGKILAGARGQFKYDLDKLSEIIVNAAKFADRYKNIKEIDFNPIIATNPNFYIVDVRIIEE
ncbi:MAG: acetate--CoA ligase family protein [Patescibacteria group bacterium]|nr:acetate--CoA ligase family protein [Patescibacteria group bacterium]